MVEIVKAKGMNITGGSQMTEKLRDPSLASRHMISTSNHQSEVVIEKTADIVK